MRRGELLRPCPACAGEGRVDRDGAVWRVICVACGFSARSARTREWACEHWNRRTHEAARVLTIPELVEAGWHGMDDDGLAAAWLETRADGRLSAVLVRLCIDLGDAVVEIMDGAGLWHEVGPGMLREYGITWRLWTWRPGPADIEAEGWGRALYGPGEFDEHD